MVTTANGEWAVADDTGRVLQRSTGAPPALPAFRAVEKLPAPGSQLPASSGPALRVLGALRGRLITQVLSVDVRPDGEVALTVSSGVVVQLGDDTQLDRKLAATQTMLSQVRPPGVQTIDVRVPEDPALVPR